MARRRRKHVHGLDWHEAMQAEPWASYAAWETTEDGGRKMRPLSRREWERGLEGKRQQMEMHDQAPVKLRALVCEHDVGKGIELYRQQMLATIERCPHGRKHPPSCPQCSYDRAMKAKGATVVGRDGEVVARAGGQTAADIIERARKRGLDV